MDKLKIILDLVRKGAITDEQAQTLLATEKEYVYAPRPVYNWPWNYPYYSPSPNIIYTSGLAQSDLTLNASDNNSTLTVSNNNGDFTCGCGTSNRASA